jgi:hypothetical protein
MPPRRGGKFQVMTRISIEGRIRFGCAARHGAGAARLVSLQYRLAAIQLGLK